MEYRAEIDIMPLKELLDPKGKAVAGSMKQLDLPAVTDVRIGKHILMTLHADSEEAARSTVESACKKLLANPVMESYSFTVHPG